MTAQIDFVGPSAGRMLLHKLPLAKKPLNAANTFVDACDSDV
jgi:hypothetical protein